ncbi:hypothetical protein V501_06056 [Pseudogymnoascus sp. VKM F-4519 (FW-2642)]|uniref:Uncharacterized protein n=1 Tax=Pseudogymnoascus verrucosus TaxID=342668 RepID=A0A1B8GC63_9PEZI|nr:uncharacterized protein VE01_08741 [Pseudogymnoascus verrucosus]KFY77397.1 hypothetical protein V499_03195 [Pseudogymnoascus sp. VKM F-103]KFZ08214.1 hypothetical protein V501_06056 [Pseudogymnoascus sp. VKM F-4519 (FW-2642)]OBT55375.1 hypothetical protein VE04_05284 [Pseudogymnoascus sp. 24MN13]OBT93421.1 hypothetical protein VE01_08741 [Pseudogymnoascus verrucosus]
MSNKTMVTCHGAVDGHELLEAGCFLYGKPGSRVAGALKSCCPEIRSFAPQGGNGSGTNCKVFCNAPTAQQVDVANLCMNKFYDEHPGIDTDDEYNNLWTCDTPDTRSAAVQGRTSWGGLVVLCLGLSTAMAML